MKDKVKYEKPKLYFCDPTKRSRNESLSCHLHGGCCKLTKHKEFARTDEKGNAIVYKGGDL